MLQRVPLLRSGAAAAETAKIVAKTMITLFIVDKCVTLTKIAGRKILS
jgi:hypothetical protein